MALTEEFFKDFSWFSIFLGQFNGVVYHDVKPVQVELHLDTCLTAFGGIFDNQCYALPIPPPKLITTLLFTLRC